MLFELIRTVKLHKCLPILISAELCGISVPFLCRGLTFTDILSDASNIGIIGGADGPTAIFLSSFGGVSPFTLISFGVTLLACFVIFVTWLKKHKEIRYDQIFFVLACMIFIPQSMTTMVRLDIIGGVHGVFFIVVGLCGAWIADSGAYFTGVAIGKKKLCPEISPKKTVEGFVGGIISTAVVFVATFAVYDNLISKEKMGLTVLSYIAIALMGAVCALVGTVGDLTASMVKRQTGIKDFGNIMPGHGGLMDRFDSVLFVLPVFYLLTYFIMV